MTAFLGIVKYEYRMSVRRWGMWAILVLAMIPYFGLDLAGQEAVLPEGTIWQVAGELALSVNMMLPLIGGIALADRLARDYRLGVKELLASTSLSRTSYVFGKYLGAVLSILTPVFVLMMAAAGLFVALGMPLTFILTSAAAFLAIIVPGYLFITAYSVVCPVIMPVRVYQVLFVGYWFWGNFTNPDFIPSISDTILTPIGRYAASGFFEATYMGFGPTATLWWGAASVAALIVGALVPLLALDRYLGWQEQRA